MKLLHTPYYIDHADGRLPMATRRTRWQRFLLWLGFEPPKKRVNVARRKIAQARRG